MWKAKKIVMRTTTDPKEHTVRIRLNDEMHSYIIAECQRQRITVSEYIRQMITKDMAKRRF